VSCHSRRNKSCTALTDERAGRASKFQAENLGIK
jgi:hypothetical protein